MAGEWIKLKELIGKEQEKELREKFGGKEIYIPKPGNKGYNIRIQKKGGERNVERVF